MSEPFRKFQFQPRATKNNDIQLIQQNNNLFKENDEKTFPINSSKIFSFFFKNDFKAKCKIAELLLSSFYMVIFWCHRVIGKSSESSSAEIKNHLWHLQIIIHYSELMYEKRKFCKRQHFWIWFLLVLHFSQKNLNVHEWFSVNCRRKLSQTKVDKQSIQTKCATTWLNCAKSLFHGTAKFSNIKVIMNIQHSSLLYIT